MRGFDDDGEGMPSAYGTRVKLLFKEGDWQLLEASKGRYNVGPRGWQSVIKHWCILKGSPYWMLLEHHDTPTRCVYCKEAMPDSIVALFKFQNMEAMR